MFCQVIVCIILVFQTACSIYLFVILKFNQISQPQQAHYVLYT